MQTPCVQRSFGFATLTSSERLGEDSFLFLWLTTVHYHAEERLFSGTFFEVPPELQKWHQAAQRLAFEGDDIFDWMVLAKGHVHGDLHCA